MSFYFRKCPESHTGAEDYISHPQTTQRYIQQIYSFCEQLQAKLYLSIINDVIESMRELFLDEGLEDRALDDLRHVSYILHNPCFIFFFLKK